MRPENEKLARLTFHAQSYAVCECIYIYMLHLFLPSGGWWVGLKAGREVRLFVLAVIRTQRACLWLNQWN